MNAIEVDKVVKRYSGHLALDSVSLNIPEGCIYGLLGPNGAGKTTLIRIINQITAPDEGNISFFGERLCQKHVYSIAYLPEERGLYKKMTVGDQAIYLSRLKGLSKHDATERLKYWFEKFEIMSWWNRKVEELSKGMQQKIQFVITVLHEPKLLIFDEPFSGFDPINAQLLKDEILELKKKGATIIFSTHNMASVEEICDSIALINKSKLLLEGRVEQIRQSFEENLYQIIIESETNPNELIASGMELVEMEKMEGERKYRLKLKLNDFSTNQLLSYFIEKTHLLEFKEVLPSMNDIFIETVKKANAHEI